MNLIYQEGGMNMHYLRVSRLHNFELMDLYLEAPEDMTIIDRISLFL